MEFDTAQRKAGKAEYAKGKRQLEELNDALVNAYRSFNSVSDPVVMDNCISEINTLRAQRNAVLRDLRELEPTRKESIWNSYQASS